MNARVRRFGLLPSAALATAAVLGVLAAIQPLIGLTVAAGIVLAYVIFNDLAVGFGVLAFLSFLATLPTSSALSPAKAVGLLIAIAWIARFTTSGSAQRDFFARHSMLTWVLISFFAWAGLTLLWARSPSASFTALTRYAPNILLIPIGYTAVRSRRDLKLVLGAIVLGAIVAAGYGVVSPPSSTAIEEGYRASGTVGDPNQLAAYLLIGLTLGAGLLIGRRNGIGVRTLAAIGIPLCVAGIFMSLSRGGLIALAATLLAATVFAGRWRVPAIAALLVVVLGGLLYFTQIASLPARERVTTSNGGSGRSDIWKLGLRMVRAHPVTGVGVGNFPIVSPDYALQPGVLARADLIFSTAPKITHNTYLEIMSETGVTGFLLFMAILCACLWCALRAARTWAARGDPTMEALARGVFLGLIGMLVADFFISEMYGKLLWVMLAMGPALYGLAESERRRSDLEPLGL
ncbi:MAG TPA: O-antigen ligase family protein [Solirubrobacteraceae bacterium]|jgi:O-antigen ligase|nr:O-antigen ligase family protein [Solirubrobacteraceae bacterium]